MKILTAAQMKQLDSQAINGLGIPSASLMENAALGVADAAERFLTTNRRAVVFCGSGNNGGDGVAAARILSERGCTVRCFLAGSREKLSSDTAEMERRYAAVGGRLEDFDGLSHELVEFCSSCGVIIDALFGTGLHSPLRSSAALLTGFINSLNIPVVSADIPSGVHTDSGRILGDAVRADLTVTFSALKPGLLVGDGGACAGNIIVHDIGIPQKLLDSANCRFFTADEAFADSVIPHRTRISHKGDYGRLLLVCGSEGYTGAPVLAARGAVRTGAGLVFLGTRPEAYPIAAARLSSPVVFPIHSFEDLRERLSRADCCLIGCGLGTDEAARELVYSVMRNCRAPLIIDADGISALARNINILDETECPVILTPHDGEFARLGGDLSSGDRLTAATDFAKAHGCVLILKGYRTICALPDGRAFINTGGNPGMAKGGSGDILAGVLCSLIAQLGSVEQACPAAVWVHSAAGDLAAKKMGEYGMAPDDIIDALPLVLKKY